MKLALPHASGRRARAAPPRWRRLPSREAREGGSRAAAQGGVAASRGFTLLELLVVISIMALATAGVSLAMRDSGQTQLEREAARLAALLESGRAQSRGTGVPVRWRADAGGFRFEGLPSSTLPTQWLDAGTTVRGPAILQLGPEPLIGPQQVLLVNQAYPERMLRVVTDGVRPFTVEPLP